MGFDPISLGIIGGTAAAAGGGKKGGNSLASQQLALQQQQLAFGKQTFETGMGAWTPAKDYWSTLLSGDKTAVNAAIGPISDQVRMTGAATGRNIASSMPAGGERNLAVALNQGDTYNNLSRLYAGVQPTAATALGQLAAMPMQAGTAIMGQAAPNIGAAAAMQANTANNKMSGASGLGSLLYSMGNGSTGKLRGSIVPSDSYGYPGIGGGTPGYNPGMYIPGLGPGTYPPLPTGLG